MDDDVLVGKLVEFIFVKKFQVTSEMVSRESSFPRCFLTDDFPHKLRCVFLTRQAIVSDVWQKTEKHLEIFCSDMLPSSEYYMGSVLGACVIEHFSLNKVFDSFVNVCCLVKFFCFKIKQKAGLDFGDLSTYIVLEFYESVLKNSFHRCGGFLRFLKYIHQHSYLKFNLDKNDLNRLDDLSSNVIVSEKLENEKRKEYVDRNTRVKRQLATSTLNSYTESMTKRILSKISIKILAPSSHKSIQKEGDIHLNEKANTAEENLRMEAVLKSAHVEELPRGLRLNSYSKGNLEAKTKQIVPLYERIVQTVIKYNRSNNTVLIHGEDQLLKKANLILNNLKDTIKSLVEVLDEYDEE